MAGFHTPTGWNQASSPQLLSMEDWPQLLLRIPGKQKGQGPRGTSASASTRQAMHISLMLSPLEIASDPTPASKVESSAFVPSIFPWQDPVSELSKKPCPLGSPHLLTIARIPESAPCTHVTEENGQSELRCINCSWPKFTISHFPAHSHLLYDVPALSPMSSPVE